MSDTHFRVNLNSVVTLMSRNTLLETGAIAETCTDTLKRVCDIIITLRLEQLLIKQVNLFGDAFNKDTLGH